MTVTERLNAAAAIATLTAAVHKQNGDTSTAAVYMFTAIQLRQAADAADGITSDGLEAIFADELTVADALMGVVS